MERLCEIVVEVQVDHGHMVVWIDRQAQELLRFILTRTIIYHNILTIIIIYFIDWQIKGPLLHPILVQSLLHVQRLAQPLPGIAACVSIVHQVSLLDLKDGLLYWHLRQSSETQASLPPRYSSAW